MSANRSIRRLQEESEMNYMNYGTDYRLYGLQCPVLNVTMAMSGAPAGSKCPSSLSTGTTVTITGNVSGGQAPYRYILFVDGINAMEYDNISSNSQQFSYTIGTKGETTGNHAYRVYVSDSCSPIQVTADYCVVSISGGGTPPPTPPPTTGGYNCIRPGTATPCDPAPTGTVGQFTDLSTCISNCAAPPSSGGSLLTNKYVLIGVGLVAVYFLVLRD